ncbi:MULTISPECIES: protease inhibitor Inh/omp19 family protein [Pseudomonas syringae group]|uniref:protease inhibitor Inh/omp19 family protein n=1 Tax=Pseudomonas syringae group TaxID=136849 RepID=UPI0001AF5A34|nr:MULTISPECIES: protease inhibitor Inh/omp19 family protein [Pseudomonas syringae group]MCQ3014006.1 protease inhibitor Inh/omp19 family protein [Pseudomonas tremae]QGL57404.1 AprI/Inh family metalloprotease inhibitor [Pseudomonas coronafaciens pv. oryzae str. 1_6]RMM35503.1 Protease inhibitor Inh [Pseudomonas coronafaciens pv. oryzae]RMS90199.1 Protease inhibitor Inh [Pseudomonas coronafaciens pv. oryzae]RMT01012.1 Protease inhibitor Inh [Pseudomonas coronafaciens pv. oryzae]
MKINHFVRIVPLAFALLVGISGASMAMSLKLPDPAELSGKWRLSLEGKAGDRCELQLNTEIPQLGGELACAAKWLNGTPAGWFPTPDGLAFTDKEGNRLIHLNNMGEQIYQARLPDGEVLILGRLAD